MDPKTAAFMNSISEFLDQLHKKSPNKSTTNPEVGHYLDSLRYTAKPFENGYYRITGRLATVVFNKNLPVHFNYRDFVPVELSSPDWAHFSFDVSNGTLRLTKVVYK